MNRYWMLVLVMLVAAAGCDAKEKAAQEAANQAQNEKVKELLEKAKDRPARSFSPPGMGGDTKPADENADKPADENADKPADEDADKDADATKEGEGDDDDDKEAEGTEEEKSDDKKDTSAQLDAHDVLNDAIAAAKADDKALLVHFTASW